MDSLWPWTGERKIVVVLRKDIVQFLSTAGIPIKRAPHRSPAAFRLAQRHWVVFNRLMAQLWVEQAISGSWRIDVRRYWEQREMLNMPSAVVPLLESERALSILRQGLEATEAFVDRIDALDALRLQ